MNGYLKFKRLHTHTETEWDEKMKAASAMVCLVHNYIVAAGVGMTGHLRAEDVGEEQRG